MATNTLATGTGARVIDPARRHPAATIGNDGPREVIQERILPTADNTEVQTLLVCPKSYQFVLESVDLFAAEVPADSDGTVLVSVIQRDTSADDDVTIVDNADAQALVAGQATTPTTAVSLPIILDEQDSLRFQVVNDSEEIDTAGEVVCIVTGYFRRIA
jgi:hypothetical protein